MLKEQIHIYLDIYYCTV